MGYSLAAVLSVFTSVSAWAQGPWTSTPFPNPGPGNGFPGVTSLMVSPSQAVWGSRNQAFGMGSSSDFVFCSVDGGQTYQQQLVADGVFDVWGIDGLKAWYVTQNGVLLATTTGPAGFSPVATAPNASLRFVRFLDATTGILVAQPATGATTWPLFRTSDGGTTWTAAPAPAVTAGDASVRCTQVGSTFWVSTRLGFVLRSTDSGQNWAQLDTGLGMSLREVCFRDALNGLAFGTTGQLRRTTDGGQNWTVVTPQGPLRLSTAVAIEGSAGTYLSGREDFAAGAQNGTSISNDNGATWYSLENSIYMRVLAARGAGSVYGGSIGAVYRYSGPLSTQAKPQVVTTLCYPNPATEVLNLPAASQARTAQLYDVAGRQQRSWEVGRGQQQLSLSGLVPGLYQFRLTEPNQAVRVQQIVVQP